MLPEAAALGAIDAADYFGLEKQAWARILGTGLGALAGSALADRDDRGQGAIMGALAGLGVSHGLARAGTGLLGAGRWAAGKAGAGLAAGREAAGNAFNLGGLKDKIVGAGHSAMDAGRNAAHSIYGTAGALKDKAVAAGSQAYHAVRDPVHAATAPLRGELDPKLQHGLDKGLLRNAVYEVQGRKGRAQHKGNKLIYSPADHQGNVPGVKPMPHTTGPQSGGQAFTRGLNDMKVRADVGMTNAWDSTKNWVASKFSADQTKEADVGMGVRVPGTPMNMSFYDGPAERLQGMHRWVPRDVIERTHTGLDAGLDPADVIHSEENRGNVLQPMIGAGVGAGLAHFGLGGKANLPATALGGLFGAGAGAAYNMFNAPYRKSDAQEALYGVMRERSNEYNFPMASQTQTTAAASTPMLVSSGANAV